MFCLLDILTEVRRLGQWGFIWGL